MHAPSSLRSRSPHPHWSVNKAVILSAAGAVVFTLLGSCGNQKATRLMNPSDAGRSADASPGEAESEFDRLHNEMLGGALGENDPESLGSFTAALDSFLSDASREGSLANADSAKASLGVVDDPDRSQSDANSQLAEREAVASADQPPANSTSESRSTAKDELPQVSWVDAVATSGEDNEEMTPADRLELVGSAGERVQLEEKAVNETFLPDPGELNGQSTERTAAAVGSRSIPRDELIVMLASQLHRDASYSPVPLREHLVNAAMMIIDEGRRIDPNELYDLNQRERELLAAYQDFFAAVGRQLYDTRDPEILVDEVNRLADQLGSNDLLEIPNFRICTSVRKFGTYEEFKSKKFIRGRSHDMIAYVEVANFSPRPAEDGQYKTVLTQETELYTEWDGTIVYRQPAVTVTDECRNKRTDFFLVRHVTLPSNLSVGSYYLKVRVRDEHSNQQGEAVIPLQIVASE